jgi:hypothetical protein
MLKLLTERQKSLIINNVVAACKDITKLNKQAYNFLYLANGFIAHYDLYGFIGHYEDYSLKNDLEINQQFNQWNNFKPGYADYEYYMQKKEIYNKILERI